MKSIKNLTTAQRGGDKNTTPEARAEKQTERLTKQLSLTESQASQITFVFENKEKWEGDLECQPYTINRMV